MYKCTDLREYVLESLGIIRLTVTLSTLGTNADEIAGGVVGILGVAAANNFAASVKEVRSLVDCGDVSLNELRGAVGALEDVALGPGIDSCGSASQHSCTVLHTDGNGNVRELDVVQYEGAVEVGTWSAATDEDRRVGDSCIDDSLCADALAASCLGTCRALNKVEPDLSVVDSDALEGPTPVPNSVDLQASH